MPAPKNGSRVDKGKSRIKPDPDLTPFEPLVKDFITAMSIDVRYAVQMCNNAKVIERRREGHIRRIAAKREAANER